MNITTKIRPGSGGKIGLYLDAGTELTNLEMTEKEFYQLLDSALNVEAELNWDNCSIADIEGDNHEI